MLLPVESSPSLGVVALELLLAPLWPPWPPPPLMLLRSERVLDNGISRRLKMIEQDQIEPPSSLRIKFI